jgi:hypothetical protein
LAHSLPDCLIGYFFDNGAAKVHRYWYWLEIGSAAMADGWSVHVLLLIVQLFEFKGVAGTRAWSGTYSFGPKQSVIDGE